MSQEVSLPPAAPCRHAPYWECTGSMLVRSGAADLEWVAADGDPPKEVGRKWLLSLFFSFFEGEGDFLALQLLSIFQWPSSGLH